MSRSTRDSRSSAPAIRAPPSTNSARTPRCEVSERSRASWASTVATLHAGVAQQREPRQWHRAELDVGDKRLRVGVSRAVRTSVAVAGTRSAESNTTRSGAIRGAGTSRTVSDGSSPSTVPMPTAIASGVRAKMMHFEPRLRSRDPSMETARVCDCTVRGERELERHPWPLLDRCALKKGALSSSAVVLFDTNVDGECPRRAASRRRRARQRSDLAPRRRPARHPPR